jgi:hypothetical protein
MLQASLRGMYHWVRMLEEYGASKGWDSKDTDIMHAGPISESIMVTLVGE